MVVHSSLSPGSGGRRFVARTLILVVSIAAVVATLNWRINMYGVFGDAQGESRTVIGNERQTKYLFSYNYIPANFDALLVGSSIASNIDTSKIHGVRMYNTALSGGNITEERLIAENALRRGHFRLLVVCLNPYLVLTHGRKAGGMSPGDFWGALGSTDLMSTYLGSIVIRRGWAHQRFTADGMQDILDFQRPVEPLKSAPNEAVPTINAAIDRSKFVLDGTALSELAELVQVARARDAAVVWVFAPVYLPTYTMRRVGYQDFENRIRTIAKTGERVIDFNDGSFTGLTAQPNSFSDGVHLSNDAALEVARTLDQSL
jgi:hypothetical protein